MNHNKSLWGVIPLWRGQGEDFFILNNPTFISTPNTPDSIGTGSPAGDNISPEPISTPTSHQSPVTNYFNINLKTNKYYKYNY